MSFYSHTEIRNGIQTRTPSQDEQGSSNNVEEVFGKIEKVDKLTKLMT